MKTKLHLVFRVIAFGIFLLGSLSVQAQISYTESFDDDQHGWDLYEFSETTDATCAGAGALSVNMLIDEDEEIFVIDAELTSPAIGVSNGGRATLSYQYKLLNSPLSPATATNSNTWGMFDVYYGYSASGPWILLESVDPYTHTPSTTCATRTVDFFPVAGNTVYLNVYAEHGFDVDNYFLYIDEVAVTQAAPVTCSTAPAAPVIVATRESMCNTQNATLTITNPNSFKDIGQSVRWEKSTDNITYTPVAGALSSTFVATQSETNYYRAVGVCANGNLSTPSAPLKIVSTGTLCYCNVSFPSNEEPITRVNFAGINKVTSASIASAVAYEDFTVSVPAPSIAQGQSYAIAVEGNTAGALTCRITVFIDWDQSGVLSDAGEVYQLSSLVGSTGTDGQQATGTILVPANAPLGTTRMRVVKRFSSAGTACNSTSYGQAEDYTVNVTAAAGTGSFDGKSFTYYPNPVKDVFNISYISDITGVEVYNLLGQQVLVKTINNNAAQIDMSALAPGTYLVKATAGNMVQTIKVVKQ